MTIHLPKSSRRPALAFLWTADGGLANIDQVADALTGQVATRTRTSTKTVIDQNGVVRTVPKGLPAYHSAYAPTMGVSYLSDLLEGSRQNSALGACSFADSTYWSDSADFTLAAATSIITGETATKHTGKDVGANKTRTQAIGTFANGRADCFSFIIENDTVAPATSAFVLIYDATAAATVYSVTFTWATHTLGGEAGTGTSGVIDLLNGRYRIWVTTTGTAAGTAGAGNTYRAQVYPTGASQNAFAAVLHHTQLEKSASFPSSPIVTVASAVTRASDVCSAPWNYAPQQATYYFRFVEAGSATSASFGIFGIGQVANASLFVLGNSGVYRVTHRVASDVNSDCGVAPTIGDLVELRIRLNTDGSVFIAQTLNNGSESVAATSAGLTLASAWANQTMLIGSRSTGSEGFVPMTHAAICLGPEQSLASMRSRAGV